MTSLLLVRHAHARANELGVASSVPPGDGLTDRGLAEARALGVGIVGDEIARAVTSEFLRAQQTAAVALAGRDVRIEVLPELNEIGFGSFEGGQLDAYLGWARASPPDSDCPGGGESRATAVRRIVGALEAILEGGEHTVLVVTHGVVVRWIVEAAAGRAPTRRLEPVEFGAVNRLTAVDSERAAAVLGRWAAAPSFADAPNGA